MRRARNENHHSYPCWLTSDEYKQLKQVDGHSRLRVPQGKDTEGSGGKPRDAYLPESVESELLRYANVEESAYDEQLRELSDRSGQRWVKKTAEAVAEATGDSDWRTVSSHDLRRHYAQTLLVRECTSGW